MLTGGPGTGKTTAVAGLLALLADQSDRPLRIALTAPTGKAAARLQEAVRTALAGPRVRRATATRSVDPTAQTLHRLLGWKRGSRNRFRHDRRNRLPHDVIVVDETSMVSLTMMARLVEAVRADCRLVLVGDPDQLASVEAGAVLADLVDGLARREPGDGRRAARRPTGSAAEIDGLAEAVRDGDADRALDLLAAGRRPRRAARPRRPRRPGRRCATAWCGHALRLRAAAASGDAGEAVAVLDRAPPALRPPRRPVGRRPLEPRWSSAPSPSTPGCRSAAAGARSGTPGGRCC